MDESLLMGIGHHTIPIPRWIWQRRARGEGHLSFMTQEHHSIRNFVVTELPRAAVPLPPQVIARALSLSLDKVMSILDDLERHMTFLFRDEQGAVEWAYPVTVADTPHRVTFSTGEKTHAA
jgi:hypothetical protein